jgi:hypothetical protein
MNRVEMNRVEMNGVEQLEDLRLRGLIFAFSNYPVAPRPLFACFV